MQLAVCVSIVIAMCVMQCRPAQATETTLDVSEDTDITSWVNWETAPRGLLMDGEDGGRGGSLRVADQDFPGGYQVNDGWILLRWDLSTIPAEDTISDVTLRMIQFDGAVGATEIWGIDQGDWEEEFVSWISWTSQTTSQTLLGTMQNVSYLDPELQGETTFNDIDLTSLVQAWHTGSHDNLGLLLKWAGGPQDGDTFASRESTTTDPARLIITHSDGSATSFGDYNGNGIIDAADYTAWRDAVTAGSSSLLNDPTPGTVDESDFAYWRNHFGESVGSGSGSATAHFVPEPTSLVTSGICTALLLAFARIRRTGESSSGGR
jgi:hypothetical protein